MKSTTDRQLMRLLHGELPAAEARELSARLAADPELARAYQRLAATWNGLELPPPAPVPWGFAAQVKGRAVAQRRPAVGLPAWRLAPAWARAAAVVALAAGLAAGLGLGQLADSEAGGELAAFDDVGLAEAYVAVLEGDAELPPGDEVRR